MLADRVLRQSDIVLLVIDARDVQGSINREIENKIRCMGKKFLYVVNKCDLISKEQQDKIKLPNSIQISAAKRWGTLRLWKKIIEMSKGKEVVVGVVGLPNTGKSMIINVLKGRHSAPTSPISGFTKGIQKLRADSRVVLLDTPGVLPREVEDKTGMYAIGAIGYEKIKNPEMAVAKLMEKMGGKIEEYFGVEKSGGPMETLEKIALKKHALKKGGLPDTARMARRIIMLCQRGEIR